MKFKKAFLALTLLAMSFGVASCSSAEVKAPEITIGDNGNWFIDGKDTGKPSKGTDGESAPEIKIGENGNWFIDGKDSGLSSKGDSAYELFLKEHPGVDISEEEWLHDYIKGDLDKYTYQRVTFIVDGKTYQEHKVEYGGKTPTIPDPTSEGKCFAGWFDANGKKFINNNIRDDATYYARFVAETSNNSDDLNFNNVTLPARPTGLNEHNLANNPQDGVILHAWSWGLQEIKKEMKNIAAAGYSSVQTSPMQPQKDYYPDNSINWWWKVYQPLGFEVAKKDNALGTKQDLIELCEEADKYGVKVIVDVVANHLAGGSENTMNPDSQEYEPEIYNNNLIHVHGKGENCDDSDPYRTTHYPLGGYPDVQTENPKVQRAVLGLLNEYVECGVDGFRFDAAKHIELPEDPEGVRSEFWNVAIKGSAKHAMDLGIDVPYSYGEILHTPGNGRDFANYTKRLSITDNTAGNAALDAVRRQDASGINRNNVYNQGIPADKAVLWGESHDTYANDDHQTTFVSQTDVNKAYAINASRKDASTLYFIRPHEFSDAPNAMRLGGKSYNQHWKSHTITEVNKFHNATIGAEEIVESDDNRYFANYKKIDDKYAAMIVNLTDNNHLANYNACENLGEGTYRDAISHNLFTVKNGLISGDFDNSGIACLYQEGKVTPPQKAPLPELTIDNPGGHWYFDTLNVNVTTKNSDESWYQINDGQKINFSGKQTIQLGSADLSDIVKLKVGYKNQYREYVNEYEYGFEVDDPSIFIATDVPRYVYDGKRVLAWTWGEDADGQPTVDGQFVSGKLIGNDFLYKKPEGATHFILATIDFNVEDKWDNVMLQSEEAKIEIEENKKEYRCTNFKNKQ